MNKLSFVSFNVKDGQFLGSLSIEAVFDTERDLEVILREAKKVYEKSIQRMRSIIKDIEKMRSNRHKIPARTIWHMGDAIFELKKNLEKQGLELDGLYQHLVRDLGVKRKWLEKVVILRRYLPKESMIPKSLNWGSCEKGTRRVAESLRNKGIVDK